MGRKPLPIDPQQVSRLAKIQCTYDEMAAVLGCSTDTLKRRFADIIEKGREAGKTSLRRCQFRVATKGSIPMLIWLGKQHLGQSDKHEHDFSKVPDEELVARAKGVVGRIGPTGTDR